MLALKPMDNVIPFPTISVWELHLKCGHDVLTEVRLRYQYEDDEHYVLCPPCRKSIDASDNPVMDPLVAPTAWQKVIGHNAYLRDVHGGLPFVMSNSVMRLQPSVPRSRVRPFPYVERRPR